MPGQNKICVIFIAQYLDEFRVIYKSHNEWLVDAPESNVFDARRRAEHCMQALYLHAGCKKNSVHIYEISMAGHLYSSMLNDLHHSGTIWQQYLDTAARILNTKAHVSMVSFLSDEQGQDNNPEPYLFIISNNMQTGQHFIDTVQLRNKAQGKDMGIVYKISEGRPRLYFDQQPAIAL